jgi:KDO2-lipid IV(A) lauroyltransferase
MPGVTAGSYLLTGLAWAARVLPPKADLPIAWAAARLTYLLRPARHRAARSNAAALFPHLGAEELDRLALQSSVSYARFLIEYVRSLGLDTHQLWERVEFRLDAAVEKSIAAGRGIIICAAHVGNWEVGAIALRKLGLEVVVVAGPQYAVSWQRGVHAAKNRNGIRIVDPSQSPRPLLRHLERGGAICLLADGDGYARGRPALIRDRPVRLPEGPSRLAARSGAVLAGALCQPVGPFRFEVELTALAGTGVAPVEDEALLHHGVATWMEGLLVEHPGNWCIFRPFFDPPEQAPGPAWERQAARRDTLPQPAELGSASGHR